MDIEKTAVKPTFLTFADMVGAAKLVRDPCLDRTLFPVKPERYSTEGLDLVHFGRVISTKDALREIDDRRLRPANIEELLAYAAQYPEVQTSHPIVALASSQRMMSGTGYFPFLGEVILRVGEKSPPGVRPMLARKRSVGLWMMRPGVRWRGSIRFLIAK